MDKKCDPACPHFRCLKKALYFKLPNGRLVPPRVARNMREPGTPWCMWAMDECRGPDCQYAACDKHALLPDGTCALARARPTQIKSIEEEARRMERELTALRSKLKKLGLRGLDLDID